MTWRRIKRALTALAFVGVPLVVSASCDRFGGASFYRDDDYDDSGFWDVWVEDDYWYNEYYYDEVIFLP